MADSELANLADEKLLARFAATHKTIELTCAQTEYDSQSAEILRLMAAGRKVGEAGTCPVCGDVHDVCRRIKAEAEALYALHLAKTRPSEPEGAPVPASSVPLYSAEELEAEGLQASTTDYGKEGKATMYSRKAVPASGGEPLTSLRNTLACDGCGREKQLTADKKWMHSHSGLVICDDEDCKQFEAIYARRPASQEPPKVEQVCPACAKPVFTDGPLKVKELALEASQGIWLAYPVLRERLELDRDVFIYNVRDLIAAIFLPVAALEVEAEKVEGPWFDVDKAAQRCAWVADAWAIKRNIPTPNEQALGLLRLAMADEIRKFIAAPQPLPVEAVAREIREQIQDDLDALGGRPVILKTSTADIAAILSRHAAKPLVVASDGRIAGTSIPAGAKDAPKDECGIVGCHNHVAESRFCVEHITGNQPPKETV